MHECLLDTATAIEGLLAAGRRDGESRLEDVAERIATRFACACLIYLRSERQDGLIPVVGHSEDVQRAARMEEFVGAASWTSPRVLLVLEALGTVLASGTPSELDVWLGTTRRRHASSTELRSMIAVPVHSPASGLVGAIVVARHDERRFERADRDALCQLATSLADSLDRERLAWELRARAATESRAERELLLAQRRFAAAFHASPVPQALFTVGPGPPVLVDVNHGLAALLAATPEALLERPSLADFVHPGDLAPAERAVSQVLAGSVDVARLELRVLPHGGSARRCELSFSLIRDDDGAPQYAIAQLFDVTAVRRGEARLARHVRRQSALASVGRSALGDRSWQALADAAVPELAVAIDAMRGCLLTRTPEGGAAVLTGPAALALDEPLPDVPLRLDARRLPATWLAHGARSALVAPIGSEQPPRAWLALLAAESDALEADDVPFAEAAAHLLAAAEEARRRATRDVLTDLPNRALFADRVAHALARAARTKTAVAVVCVDVDRFKDVNETFGHPTGDELLRTLGRQLGGALRASDTLARIGGDEFGVLCEDVGDERGAIAAVRRLMATFEAPVTVAERSLYIAASFGVALALPGSPATPEALLRDADIALHRAKERHGIGFELFDHEMRRRVSERLRIEQDLRRALEQDQFVLHYQPLVSLRSRQIVGVEALVRWEHPERGMIAPGAFIGVAEDTGLIVPLGRWVLAEACRQLARWQADPALAPIYVSVNLSGRQLAVPELADQIEESLRRTGVAPGRLALELTESVLMEEAGSPAALLQTLHEQGVQLLLDDFGTGYSSLNYVKRFPLHGLKVDRSFIAGLPDDEGDRAMLRAIVNMAAALDLSVLAEGVETLEQASWLSGLDCGAAQGFGLARPAPASAIEPLLRDGLPRERLAWPPVVIESTDEATVPLSEAADALGISASTIRRWADAGRLEAIRTPGGHRRFRSSEIKRLAQESRGRTRGALRSLELPRRPIPSVAATVARRPDLVPLAAASIYQPGRPGWFASDVSAPILAGWVERLRVACRDGDYLAAVEATRRMLAQAEYAGTTLLERCLCLERCRDAVLRELRDSRVPSEELAAARRLAIRLTWLAVEA